MIRDVAVAQQLHHPRGCVRRLLATQGLANNGSIMREPVCLEIGLLHGPHKDSIAHPDGEILPSRAFFALQVMHPRADEGDERWVRNIRNPPAALRVVHLIDSLARSDYFHAVVA
eukprot:6950259-Pyramimonas_sp.AAC.1